MTEQEIQALIQIINRAPMTQGETLWVTQILNRELQRARAAAEAIKEA